MLKERKKETCKGVSKEGDWHRRKQMESCLAEVPGSVTSQPIRGLTSAPYRSLRRWVPISLISFRVPVIWDRLPLEGWLSSHNPYPQPEQHRKTPAKGPWLNKRKKKDFRDTRETEGQECETEELLKGSSGATRCLSAVTLSIDIAGRAAREHWSQYRD
ncbi:UNVERIFIED_CONTAM: hypothetical protein FKN15_021858 [Acipenser sinensis]